MDKKSFIYRFLTIASLLSGIILNLVNTSRPSRLMLYYTMQSNMICLVILVFFTIRKKAKKDIYNICKGAITIAILLTAIVYLVALLPNDFPMYKVSEGITGKAIGNILVHIVSPILVVLDYLLLDEKGTYKIYYPWLWLILPCSYVCFVYLFHAKGGVFYSIGGSKQFAYFFLDYKVIGIKETAYWIIIIAVVVLALGYLLIAIDKKLAKKSHSLSRDGI